MSVESVARKAQGIAFGEMRRGEVVFTHLEAGVQTVYAVSRIERALETREGWGRLARVPVEAEFAGWLRDNRGVEQWRVERLHERALRSPLLFAEQPDGSHLLIDGTHRYVALAERGERSTLAWLLTPREWREFTVRDAPTVSESALRAMPSGMEREG